MNELLGRAPLGPPSPALPRAAGLGSSASSAAPGAEEADLGPRLDDCWNRVGAQGDRSCPELSKHVHCRNCPVYAGAGARLFEREPPAEWLDERTRRLAECEEAVASDLVTVLIFRWGEEWMALDVTELLEVAELRPVHVVPHRIGGLLQGIVNIRGELQLCVSLDRLLSVKRSPPAPAGPRPTERLVVAEHQGQRWAFSVDEVSGVHRLLRSQLTDLPATIRRSSSRLTSGVFDWEDKRVGYLDAERVFPLLEQGVR